MIYQIKQCIYFSRLRTSNYYYSIWMVSKLWPIWIRFFYIFCCNIIKFKQNIFVLNHYVVTFISSFLHTRSLSVPCVYISIESFDSVLLPLLELKIILLISSVKALCFSLLKLCCVFNISLLFVMNSFLIFLRSSASILFSSKWFIVFSI